MLRGKGAETHQRGYGGSVEGLDQFAEFLGSVGRNDAATCINKRPLGFPHHLRGAPDLPGVPFREHLVTGQVNGGHGRVMRLGLKDILRNVDEHRTGTSARGNIECFMDHLGQVRNILDQEIVLRAGSRDPESVGFLKSIAADQLGGNLSGDGDNRD